MRLSRVIVLCALFAPLLSFAVRSPYFSDEHLADCEKLSPLQLEFMKRQVRAGEEYAAISIRVGDIKAANDALSYAQTWAYRSCEQESKQATALKHELAPLENRAGVLASARYIAEHNYRAAQDQLRYMKLREKEYGTPLPGEYRTLLRTATDGFFREYFEGLDKASLAGEVTHEIFEDFQKRACLAMKISEVTLLGRCKKHY